MAAVPDADLLAHALDRVFERGVTVGALQRVSGGASRETWLMDAREDDGTLHRVVLRRDPGRHGGWTDRATEFALLAAAHSAGVPVPKVLVLLRPDDALGEGFFMERVDGETIPRKILRDPEFAGARANLAAQCGTVAARIHAVDTRTLPPSLAVQTASSQLAQWRSAIDGFGEPHAAFELALRFLAEHVTHDSPTPRLVHGDFRNGNFMVGPEGIRAVLDWELSHIGDPIEDLGWLCVRSWRFAIHQKVVGGFGDVEDLLTAYAAAGGVRPSLEELRFWTVLGTLKWGVMCMMQAFTHLNGAVRSVELAAIGRRVAETEHDVLTLLDGGW